MLPGKLYHEFCIIYPPVPSYRTHGNSDAYRQHTALE
jgi:hypothetical protein